MKARKDNSMLYDAKGEKCCLIGKRLIGGREKNESKKKICDMIINVLKIAVHGREALAGHLISRVSSAKPVRLNTVKYFAPNPLKFRPQIEKDL
jgi:hypothetical protein